MTPILFAVGIGSVAASVAAKPKPNIIFILTDDQDIMLGGMEPMPKTRRMLGEGGATATHWFIHTPVCCPSRAETLTGKYFHNVKIGSVEVDLSVVNTTKSGGGCGAQNNGCMCVDDKKVNAATFAVDLARVGYKVGMFGKYLNSWSGKIQPGFSRWFANGGGAYFNTTFNDDRSPTGIFTANASFYSGYQTSILGNVSINWIKEVVTKNGTAGKGYAHPPFFAYIGVHAPHLPSTPAPWYTTPFADPSLANRYRTPNFNYSATDHHWCVAQQPPVTEAQVVGIDALFRDRWRTLLSVDDLVEGVVNAAIDLNVVDNTYFFYSSDHGYNLGQLRLTGNKLHAYEHTLRIPMYVRGPGIKKGTKLSIPGSNTDFAPTWLALAGLSNSAMDGTSFAAHLMPETGLGGAPKPTAWRDFHFSEYNSLGNLWRGGGEIIDGDHLIDDPVSHTYRALRFTNSSVYGNALYVEYTSLIDWNFENYSSAPGVLDPYSYKFYEWFDLDADPWQYHNIYRNATEATKQKLHILVASEFKCSGAACS